ncbi:hypothetical protein GmHk_18G051900 [Glycine max]|nr:hypothetical protein GmHk_18G051900 [Glycine max]
MSDATMMVTHVMLGHGYEPGMGLGKNNDGKANLVDIKENRGKFGLGYKPTRTDMRRSVLERRNRGMGPQLRPQVREAPPCHISESSPCLPNFQLGNWQVVERPEVSMAGTISDDESCKGTNIEDPAVDFERETN